MFLLTSFRSAVAAHHRTAREEHGDKNKANYHSRSPTRPQRERVEAEDARKPGKRY